MHIISLRIDETGKKINDSYEVARSMKICKELEQEFGLVPLQRTERPFEFPKKIIYTDRVVINGSRLGKEFSANVFNDLFNNQNSQIVSEIPKQIEKVEQTDRTEKRHQIHQQHQTTNTNSILSAALNLLDVSTQSSDYEEENFINRHKFQAKKAKKRGRRM